MGSVASASKECAPLSASLLSTAMLATVDDLERIAGEDEADVPALHGWRRELFGEKALALKQGRLSLAVETDAWWRGAG